MTLRPTPVPSPSRPPRPPRLRVLAVAAACALSSAAFACGDSPVGPDDPRMSAAAAAYLDSAFSMMQGWYYYRDTVNWNTKYARARDRAAGAQTTRDVHSAVQQAVAELGDGHSFFYPPGRTLGTREDPATPFYTPMSSVIAPRIAYLWVPTFGGRSSIGRADTIQRAIARGDSTPNLCGWILDVRGNPGGFWPAMLVGLSPLITSGRVGGFVERDTTQRYFYEVQPGAALFNLPNGQVSEVLRLPASYRVRRPDLPIAILQGDITASAGEIIVMAFKEPARAVRTFGAPTLGATTQPYTHVFADTSSIQIAAAMMFDRQRRNYLGKPIAPDEAVAGPTVRASFVPGSRDAVIDAATNWLRTQPACAAGGAARIQGQPGSGTWLPTRTTPGAMPWRKGWTPWVAR